MDTLPLETLFLRRSGLVFVAPGPGRPRQEAPGVDVLEAQLLELGYVLSRELNLALRALPGDAVAARGAWIQRVLAAELGADRPHVPLFRKFPRHVPKDTWGLYVRRVLVWLLQAPEQPCLLCGEIGTVHPLDPCAHLVCRRCWDGSNYSACPICNRRISLADPFYQPTPPEKPPKGPIKAGTLKLLHLGADLDASARDCWQRLLARVAPLTPGERADLTTILAAYRGRVLDWMPAAIPVKETQAIVLAGFLDHVPVDRWIALASAHLRTATDLLRTLVVWMGAPPDLLTRPKPLRSMPRALRRGVLGLLERLDPRNLIEDLGRHRDLWKRVGSKLHPFEHHAELPNTALAFAVLRRSRPDPDGALFTTLARAADRLNPSVTLHLGRELRYRSWGARLELALARRELPRAVQLLAQRPGELLRRLDHVLRASLQLGPADQPALLAALPDALPRASPALLLTVLAHLRARGAPIPRRVFFPRGEVTRAFTTDDARPVLTADAIGEACRLLEDDLLRRAAARPALDHAVLDAGLADLIVPFHEQTTSKALVAVPRGSNLPIPDGDRIRLFLHWTQPEDQRVDLDLSVACFGDAWEYRGKCDFTNLTYEEGASIHSGDLTSAPPPLGAAEFVDLDLELLQCADVRYLLMIVFSYNGVAFEKLPDAFAGFMLRTSGLGKRFDARAVAQRFDLQGDSEVAMPLVVDVKERRMRWIDVHMRSRGSFHQVGTYTGALRRLGLAMTDYFGAGTRMTLWELACLHAAARTPCVHVRQATGRVATYLRRDGEAVRAFFRRLVRRDAPDTAREALPALQAPALLALLADDLPAPSGSQGYSLRWRQLSPEHVRRLAASDLVAELAEPPGPA